MLTALIHHTHARIIQLHARADALAAQGTCTGSAYWKSGKYLVVLYGRQYRQYIGNDPALVAATLAAISRGQEVKQIEESITLLSEALRAAVTAQNAAEKRLRNALDRVKLSESEETES